MGPTTGIESNNESSEEIRRDIEDTRAEMSQTIDQIQAKLNPEHVKAQVKETVREATIGRAEQVVSNAGETARGAGYSFLETIKENPVPAALAGIGLGWLAYASRQNEHSFNRYRARHAYSHDPFRGGNGAQSGRGLTDKAADMAGSVQEKAADMAGTMHDKASHAADAVRERAGDLAETAGDWADTAGDWAESGRESAHHLSAQAHYQAQRAAAKSHDVMDESPLIGGAIALALGAAIGFMLPETRQEDEWMGAARDQVVDQVKDVASTAAGRAQDVASTAVEAAKRAGKEAVQAGKEAAQSEMQASKQEVQDEAKAAADDVKEKAKSTMASDQSSSG
jgi:hypothetical protein